MAITAHYLFLEDNGTLALCSHLIAFRWVPGSHAGINLADTFIEVLEPLHLLSKVRFSPNNQTLVTLFDLLTSSAALDIDYNGR